MEKLEVLANLIFGEQKDVSYYEEKYPQRNLDKKAQVTRFAPSPTGFVHMGGLYISLLCKMLSKESNGVFYVRIEDTDTKRTIDDGINQIIYALDMYDLKPDEGPKSYDEQVGNYGPYIQSQREDIYKAYAKKLVMEGKAYPCFFTPEELEEIREKQRKSKLRTGMYSAWAKYRDLPVDMAIERIQNGDPYVLRLRSTGNFNNKIVVEDLIKGKMELSQDDQDIVIIKKDGLPTYHFAHVIDDHLMKTTLVIRGDEWIPSLALHINLFKEMGFEPPKYAHVAPLAKIDDGNKRKLSKRKDPEAAAMYYKEEGIPTQAVNDYLLNIANSSYELWRKQNPHASMFDFDFKLSKMNAASALFDMTKLLDVSKNYISNLTKDQVYEQATAWAKVYDQELLSYLEGQKDRTLAILNIEREQKKPRKDISCYSQLKENIWYMYDEMFKENKKTYEFPENLQKMLDENKEETMKLFVQIANEYLNTYSLSDEKQQWFDKLKDVAEKVGFAREVKLYKENPENYKGHVGDVATIVRVILTTKQNTPDLYEICKILGINEMKQRVEMFQNM